MEFDFAQNTKVADLTKVPKDFQGLYKQVEDGFALDSDSPGVKSAISAVQGLNTALRASRAEVTDIKKTRGATVDLSPLKDFGTTIEEIQTNVSTKINDLTQQIKGVNVDKIKSDLATEWSGKYNAEKTRATNLETQLYQELVDSRATAALAGAKGNVDLLLPFVTKQVKTQMVNGKYQVNVVDQAGDIRYSGHTGAPMSINELVAELKTNSSYAAAFASDAPAGGGTAPGSTAQGAAANAAQRQQQQKQQEGEKSSVSKIAAGLKAGQFQRAGK